LNLSDAQSIAKSVTEILSPLCHRCEVAGSTRRLKPCDIKDVEIVLIPRAECVRTLADVINQRWGPPTMGKWPAGYTKIRAQHNLDIFTTTARGWGMCYFIRTGPAEFVTRCLAYWKTITGGGYSKDCVLHLADGTPMDTPEEVDVFRVLEQYGKKPCRFVPPEKRFAEKVKSHASTR
jgi:DNA polymerase/3'-5' exonuclease PolX